MIKFLVNQLPNFSLIGLDVLCQAVTPLGLALCAALVVRSWLAQRVVSNDSAGGEISLVVRILYPSRHALPAVDVERELLGPDVLPQPGPGGHQLGSRLRAERQS